MSRSRIIADPFVVWFLRGCALVAGSITVLVAVFLVTESLPAFRNVGLWRFFSDSTWHPQEHAKQGTFNLVPMFVGTLLVSAGAVLLATPFGIGAAIFCHSYAPRPVARLYRRATGLLAGIPSVVLGFWGLAVLVPINNKVNPPGQSLFAATLILALMVFPTVTLMADASLKAVPGELLNTAASLGLSRWGTVQGVMLPVAKPGIFAGVTLALGRAVGETLAVLMVCGNIVQVPGSFFDPVRTLTTNIALEMAYALGDHRSSLFITGLFLVGLVALLVVVSETFGKRRNYVLQA